MRWTISKALEKIDEHWEKSLLTDAAIPDLIDALNDPKRGIRLAATKTIGRIGLNAREAIPNLVRLLHDQDDEIRKEAAWTLSRMGPKASEAIPSLVKMLKDENKNIRVYAAKSLHAINPQWQLTGTVQEAVPELVESLNKSKDLSARVDAARALGKIGEQAKGAVPDLIAALRDPSPVMICESVKSLGAHRGGLTEGDSRFFSCFKTGRLVHSKSRNRGALSVRTRDAVG